MDKNEQFYTTEQAAALLSCNIRVLRDKLSAGEIKGYKKLKKWYIFHSDLVGWIKGEKT